MEFKELNILLDKYFSGNSSLEEEQKIKQFFSEEIELSGELKRAKAMFDFFRQEREKKMKNEIVIVNKPQETKAIFTKKLIYTIAAIAASILLYYSVINHMHKTDTQIIYAYVDGKPIMDKEQAKIEAEKALLLISENLNEGSKNLMQLSSFSKAEEIAGNKN